MIANIRRNSLEYLPICIKWIELEHLIRLTDAMIQDRISKFIRPRIQKDGLTETSLPGIQLFRATQPLPCVPAVYEPSVIAIVSGTKEAVFDGAKYTYGNAKYLCCPTSLPIKAGTPNASPEAPLLGVFVSLNARVMSELALEMENAVGAAAPQRVVNEQTIQLVDWDDAFSDAMWRLLSLLGDPMDTAVLAEPSRKFTKER